MSDPYKVQPLPPTDGIKDPQMRSFADAMVSAWRLRNGEIGATDAEKFITKKEFQGLLNSGLEGIFSGGDGVVPALPGVPANPGLTNAQLIKTLTDSILKSRLYLLLGQRIQLLTRTDSKNFVDAGLSNEVTIRVGKDNALASAINRIWAYVGDGGALIEDGQLAAVTPAAAFATAWTQVQSALIDPNTGLVSAAAVRATFESYVSAVDGTMNASYIVQAQISSAGETIVGGFGLMAVSGAGSAQGPNIAFGVRADTFFIAGTSATPSLATQLADNKVPFIVVTTVQTIDGIVYQPGVYMKTAFIVDASIDSAKIKRASITSLELDGNAVTFPLSSPATASVTLSTSWQTISSATGTFGIPASGTAPAVTAAVSVNGLVACYPSTSIGLSQIDCRIIMDGAQVGGIFGATFGPGYGGTVQCAANTSGIVGSHTFQLQVRRSIGTDTFVSSDANLEVLGVYR